MRLIEDSNGLRIEGGKERVAYSLRRIVPLRLRYVQPRRTTWVKDWLLK